VQGAGQLGHQVQHNARLALVLLLQRGGRRRRGRVRQRQLSEQLQRLLLAAQLPARCSRRASGGAAGAGQGSQRQQVLQVLVVAAGARIVAGSRCSGCYGGRLRGCSRTCRRRRGALVRARTAAVRGLLVLLGVLLLGRGRLAEQAERAACAAPAIAGALRLAVIRPAAATRQWASVGLRFGATPPMPPDA
jgi:hypothetical protein